MNRSRSAKSMEAGQLVMPILSAGRHRNARQGACFMEFASYLAGERWSDHPACTHPLLAALARDVNDLTSTDARNGLTPLIHRVVGLTSNDPRVTHTIAMMAACAALPIASQERQQALALGMLNILARTDDQALRSLAADAFAQAPNNERWAKRYMMSWPLPRSFTFPAALAIVHTSAVGIALACVQSADARLGMLLREVIDYTESVVRPAVQVAEVVLERA